MEKLGVGKINLVRIKAPIPGHKVFRVSLIQFFLFENIFICWVLVAQDI